MKFGFVVKSIASALREVSHQLVVDKPRITNKAESLVVCRGRLTTITEGQMHTVGIDVGKHRHVAYALDSEGKTVGKALHFNNDREGFEQLMTYLGSLSEPTIGLEATGHYWLALYSLLAENDYTVFVLNPLQIHAFRRSGIRKRKNDRYDALWIADYIRISRDLWPSTMQPDLVQLRELTRFRARLGEQVGDCVLLMV